MTNAELHYKKMTETPVARLIVRLGVPTTISMLITSIYNMADTYFVGTLGPSAQAATGVLFTVQAIMQGIAFMFGHGGGTFIARALADKNTKEATKYISSAFFVGGIFVSFLTYVINTAKAEDQAKYLTYSATIQAVFSAFGYLVGGLLGEYSIRGNTSLHNVRCQHKM